jgi:glycosyltransferase involved in cell wall biosynthesis
MRGKILVLANSCWHIYHYHLALLLQLQQQGYTLAIAAPDDPYRKLLKKAGLTNYHPLYQLEAHNRYPWKEAQLLWEIFAIIRREKPALVLSYTIKPNLYGSLAAAWLQIPIVPTLTGLGYTFLHQKGWNSLIPLLYRWSFRKLKRIVFQNPADLDLFVRRKLIQANQAILIPGSGIDLQRFSFQPFTNQQSERVIFLYLGRLLADKGLRELADAAQKLHAEQANIEIWIAGALQNGYPASINAKELHRWIDTGIIRYWGYCEDVRPLIAACHVLVLPSYREGLSRALLEGMATGRALLTTDVPGCRDLVISNQNGILVPPRDAASLYQAMRKMAAYSQTELAQMGRKSAQLTDSVFSNQAVCSAYIEHIQNLIPKPSPGLNPLKIALTP